MKLADIKIYKCPVCLSSFVLTNEKDNDGIIIEGQLKCDNKHEFNINAGIPDFTWPKELANIDEATRLTYEKLAAEYEKFASFPFWTFKWNESDVRTNMTNRLNLREDSIVLEIGAGDGRGAEFVAKKLGKRGLIFCRGIIAKFSEEVV